MHNRSLALPAALAVLALGLSACGGSGFDAGGEDPSASGEDSAAAKEMNDNPVEVLIGSSGDAETKAVKDAVAAWSKKEGVKADVVVASDLVQQASQGFASGSPADVLYVTTDSFTGWAENGSLLAYGDDLPDKDDFYPALREAFTHDDQFFCAPKDFSTLALVINDDLWTKAGLTDADVPTTWDELRTVSKKLTADGVTGLVLGPEIQRAGVFLAQNGGGLVTDGKATANSTENVEALEYLKQLMTDGVAAYSSDVGTGWGGEALITGKAAMVIEGNWMTGALSADAPDMKVRVAELPAGKTKGTLQYSTCWGIAADGDNTAAAQSLVEFLTSKEQQLTFSEQFGPMPSIESAKEDWIKANPDLEAFVLGADYAQNLPAQAGASDVIKEVNSQLASLKTGDPKAMLDSIQPLLEPVVEG
ncbi:extracellular solute-binding protein [uncultured Tessaracoccus sp.]|uniref:sugar ABC transporter substrate-binding protein n=1 Tax=uncultured Tessaracoccus sp. TaxID=905023 RepID=UPI0025F18ECE|nr:extracellular solute-binding protein [uncultured Tessaracoccus sp.]